MDIGAHVSTAGGLDKAIDRARALEAEAVQIFGSPPQAWALKPHPADVVQRFKDKAPEAGIRQVFLHAVYLINLATDNPDHLVKGVESLRFYLTLAHQIEARGVIFHVGSHKGAGFDVLLPQVARAMREALETSEGEADLVIENNAGHGEQVGDTFSEIRRIMDEVASPRVKVCLDTCHCIASSYEVSTPEGVAATMEAFDREIGLEHLVAVHANDSKGRLGSHLDRHENIGDGYIGREGFLHILRHPAFREVPFLLEVPGLENKGPDLENVRRLKAIREEARKAW